MSYIISVDGGRYTATLKAATPSDHSITLEGRRYAVMADPEALPVVLATLHALYPGSVTSSAPLLGRVSTQGAHLRAIPWAGPTREDPIDQLSFSPESLQELEEYARHPIVGFSGVIVLQDAQGVHMIASLGMDPQTPFAIHSIGKVFTGILALQLIREGLIPEAALDQPILLDPSVLAALPLPVRAHLEERHPTLRQVMLHQGGLGEYLDKYIDAIGQAVESGEPPPQMNRPEDFLRYAEVPTEETHYSNLGILLVGLSLQHLTRTPFDTLLQRHVLAPASIEHFSSQRPPNARVRPEDPLAAHIAGSPAGGYWTTAADLCALGAWTALQWKDPNFVRLIETFGGEFYAQGQIWHKGLIPSSSACFSSFPKYGITIAVLSDKNPGAPEMDAAIRSHMLHAARASI